jgi:flavin-dependent dehydrogenase
MTQGDASPLPQSRAPERQGRPATMPELSCDVLVIGGGPAGSTIATLLSRRGWNVVLLEKDRHPRFHIGESLLPRNMPLLEQLGVMPEIERIGVLKRAVDLTLPTSDERVTLNFSQAFDATYPTAFQVKRAEFDHVLLKNCAANGTRVLEGVEAQDVTFTPDGMVDVAGVDESGDGRRWRARFLVDASGRQTFMADRLQLKARNRRHNSAAVFAHLTGVDRRPGEDAGNISLYWFEHGWFWLIPLRDGITSVGAVVTPAYLKTRTTALEQFFLDTVAQCRPLAGRMRSAALASPVTATGNYSYFSTAMFGDRFLMVGDAYAFIDPVFSTGVYLAMYGATSGADAVDACLRDPTQQFRYLRRHERLVRRGLRNFSWFIYRFTTPAIQKLFMSDSERLNIKRAVISLLAGDAFDNRALAVPLMLFKLIYYAETAAAYLNGLPSRLRARRSHRTGLAARRVPRSADR